jgi:hypothetical protein
MELTRDRTRDLLRSMGGLLFASGGIALDFRKSATWGPGGRMLAILIPAVVLYGLALNVLGERKRSATPVGDAEPWQSVFMVFAVILNAIWLTLFFHWVHAHGALVTFAVFLLTGISAAYAAWRANVKFAGFLGALSLLIAWLALWDKILNHPSGTTNRWLLIIVGVIFLAGSVWLARRGRRESSEVITVAGIAGVLGASLGVFVTFVELGLSQFSTAGGVTTSLGGLNAKQHFIWDLLLLLIVLASISYGARSRVRGPGYVGAIGILIFLISVGDQLSVRLSGGSPSGSVVGWPLVLLLAGAAALALGFIAARVMGPAGQAPPNEASQGPPPSAG